MNDIAEKKFVDNKCQKYACWCVGVNTSIVFTFLFFLTNTTPAEKLHMYEVFTIVAVVLFYVLYWYFRLVFYLFVDKLYPLLYEEEE